MDEAVPESLSENSAITSGIFKDICSVPLEPHQRPGHLEIVLPPAVMLVILILSIIYLIVSGSRERKHKRNTYKYFQDSDKSDSFDSGIINDEDENKPRNEIDHIIGDGEFFNAFDHEALISIRKFYNQPSKLVQICLPAFLSLIVTAVILMLHQPITTCLWPGTDRPDVNTAITCFLAPAGLIYALSFGFTFQQVLEKHRGVLVKITNELSMLDQLATMTTKMNLPTKRHEMAVFKAIKSEAIFLALLIQKREPSSLKAQAPKNIKVHIWSLIDILRDVSTHPEYNFNLNRILADKMFKHLLQLNDICIDRMGVMHARIPPMKWVFLEVLGGIVVIGIMLVDAYSRRMEMTMCEVTIFSISMLCYVLADLDSPFNGFFRVDIAVLPEVTSKLENMYLTTKAEYIRQSESDKNPEKDEQLNNNHHKLDTECTKM